MEFLGKDFRRGLERGSMAKVFEAAPRFKQPHWARMRDLGRICEAL